MPASDFFLFSGRSENQLEAELHLPHRRSCATDGTETIWRIRTIRIPPGEEVGVGIGPVRMVGGVECLPAKLHHLRLGEIEILNQGGIYDEDPWSGQGVAANVSKGSEYLWRECVYV